MSDLVLVLNCGSSSIKFALYQMGAQPQKGPPPRRPEEDRQGGKEKSAGVQEVGAPFVHQPSGNVLAQGARCQGKGGGHPPRAGP